MWNREFGSSSSDEESGTTPQFLNICENLQNSRDNHAGTIEVRPGTAIERPTTGASHMRGKMREKLEISQKYNPSLDLGDSNLNFAEMIPVLKAEAKPEINYQPKLQSQEKLPEPIRAERIMVRDEEESSERSHRGQIHSQNEISSGTNIPPNQNMIYPNGLPSQNMIHTSVPPNQNMINTSVPPSQNMISANANLRNIPNAHTNSAIDGRIHVRTNSSLSMSINEDIGRPEIKTNSFMEPSEIESFNQPYIPVISSYSHIEEPETQKEEEKLEEIKEPVRSIREIHANKKEMIKNAMSDMGSFLVRGVPFNLMLQCTIRRDRSGFGRLFPKYYMRLSNGLGFLLAAKKCAGNKSSNYMVTTDQKEFSKKAKSYISKIKSNFLGTEFHVYSPGLNPSDKKANFLNVRGEQAAVLYKSNIMGNKGPRQMTVLLPHRNEEGIIEPWKPMKKEQGMVSIFNSGDKSRVMALINKPAKWNDHVQAYVLNFNGRVDKPSVKNFQLAHEDDLNTVLLQFGRVADNEFNIDFRYPISPVQAFGIALSCFDYKFACE